MITLVWD